MVLKESRVWYLGKCLALYPSTKKRHVGMRRSRKYNLFSENSLKGQIRSEAIALLVPTRLVVLGQSKGLNCIARLGVMIYGVLTPQTLPLGSGGSDGSGNNAGPEDASRK